MYKVGEESFYWDFKVKVKSSRRIVSYLSSSHTLVSCDDAVNENPLQIALTLADGQTPNKDFVFIYTIEDFHLPSLVFGRTDNSSTAMLSFIPKLSELDIPDA